VIVDATFLTRAQRAMFTELADRLGTPWWILRCAVSPTVARERLVQRAQEGGTDPSEADAAVLAHQWRSLEALTDEEVARAIDGGTDDEHAVERTEDRLRERAPELCCPA
jgi:predicted kinase